MDKKIVGIVGSYHKGGIIDSIVNEILTVGEEQKVQINKIYLIDKDIKFCTNCRQCTQNKGPKRGKCIHNDDIDGILKEIENSDAVIIGAPVNYYNVTAITRKFMERLICYNYWPWGKMGRPQLRNKKRYKKAILVTSSCMPAFLGRIFTGAVKALEKIANTLGAKVIKTLFVGSVAINEKGNVPAKILHKARKAGENLFSSI